MEVWMKRNPEFVLMKVMLTTKPLPLLVALRDQALACA
jgi:hypothetical protein